MKMVSVSQLYKSFGQIEAVKDLSFNVSQGEIFGLLGPNGAGKTTTITMIVGMQDPTSGTIEVAGRNVATEPTEVKKRIGYVPENCALYENLTAREYLELIGNLHHLPRDRISSQIEKLMRYLDLEEEIDRRMTGYSKGMKQKILLTSALLHNPDLMILDEPFSGLDSNSAAVFKQLITQLSHAGKTVIFSSHVLEVVEKLCTRLLIIHKGEKLAEGTTDEIMAQAGEASLTRAFSQLTGVTDIEDRASNILDALE
ncbi:MAG: ABC transporter ATP-binding protein [candidate division Zixibacteria bacterium]|nr:ABC transporter ATP-binding protein [candidate division Zixibacteria bacterium]